MGLFDDISYGLGISDSKPSGYDERTANSIEKNQGSAAADRYRDGKGIGSGAAAGLTFGSTPVGDLASNQVQNAAPTELRSYGPNPSIFGDLNKDRQIGYRAMIADMSGQPLLPFGDVTADDIKPYQERTEFTKSKADKDFMGTGMSQADYARGQQYGFTRGADGQMSVSSGDRGPAPTITDPNAPNFSTDFNPNNAFLRNRMRMYQEQGGGILPPAGGTQPTPSAPPSPRPLPTYAATTKGIMGCQTGLTLALRCATLLKTITG